MLTNNPSNIYSQAHLNWLKEWGIPAEIALSSGWRPTNTGFLCSTGEGFRKRLINADSRYQYKAIWDNQSAHNPMPSVYGLHLINSPITSVWVVNGEKSVLAMRSAGFQNVVSTFGELSKILEAAKALKGTSDYLAINHIPDLDETGEKSVSLWRDAALEVGAYYQRWNLKPVLQKHFNLTNAQCHKKDIRDLWLLTEGDRDEFQYLLFSMPIIERQDPMPLDALPEHQPPVANDLPSQKQDQLPDLDISDGLDFGKVREQISIVDVVATQFTIKRVGQYFTTKEHDSFRCNPVTNKYFWNSRDEHGSTIDFVMRHIDPSLDEIGAVKWLYQFAGWIVPAPQKQAKSNRIAAERTTKTTKPAESGVKTITVGKRFLDVSDIPDSGVVLLKSGIGSNKTGAIAQAVKNAESAVWIAFRVALGKNTQNRLTSEGADFEFYQGLQHWMSSIPRIVTTLNSLHYVMNENGELPQVDEIILDEVEQALEAMFGKTFGGNEGLQAYDILCTLIKNAKRVILADANMTKITEEWILSLRSDVVKVENTHIRNRGELRMVQDYEQMMGMIVETLKTSTKPIAIATDQKKRAKVIYEFLRKLGYGCRVIHGENSNNRDSQAFINAIDDEMQQLDALIYTSSLGTGIDIQADVDEVFGVFFNKPVSVHDQDQMLGRCRKAKTFTVFSQIMEQQLETSAHRIWRDYVKNIRDFAKRQGIILLHGDDGKLAMDELTSSFLGLYAKIKAKNNRLAMNPRKSFVDHMTGQFELSYIAPSDEAIYHNALKAALQMVAERETNLVLTARPIDRPEYDETRERGAMTDEIYFGHIRYQIEDFYGLEINEDILSEFKDSGRSRLNLFIACHQKLENLRERDIRQIEERDPAQRWKMTSDKVTVIKALLSTVFGNRLHFDEISEHEMAQKLIDFDLLYDRLQIDRMFHRRRHHSRNPLRRLRWVLSLLGLRLDSIRRFENKTYFYQIDEDRYQKMLFLAKSRCDHHEIEADFDYLPTSGRLIQVLIRQKLGDSHQKNNKPPSDAEMGMGAGGMAS